MTDIVERLRHASLQTDYGLDIDKELMDEGWREIERLRAVIEAIRKDPDIGCYVRLFEDAVNGGKDFSVTGLFP